MIFELSQRFFFDAAHTLNREVDAASSKRVHGHTYHSEVAVKGEANSKSGMVFDLGILRAEIERVRLNLDHQFLDELMGLGPPTLENLCLYIHHTLADAGVHASRVSVWREGIGDRCDLRPV